MIYLLSRQFSPNIAIPCTLSLTFMTYHIYLSQNGQPYSLIMFVGMAGLYFFMRHLQTLRRRYLIFAAIFCYFILCELTSFNFSSYPRFFGSIGREMIIKYRLFLFLNPKQHHFPPLSSMASFCFFNSTVSLSSIPSRPKTLVLFPPWYMES